MSKDQKGKHLGVPKKGKHPFQIKSISEGYKKKHRENNLYIDIFFRKKHIFWKACQCSNPF